MRHKKPFKSVNWSSGWIPFLIGLLTCFFWGGAVRVVFSDYQLSQWLNERLKNHSEEWNLEVQEPRLILSRGGGVPAFGFEIQLARVTPKNTCKYQNGLQVVQTYIPVSILKSISQQTLVVEKLRVKQATLLTFESDCTDEDTKDKVIDSRESDLNASEAIKRSVYSFKTMERILFEFNNSYSRLQEIPLKTVQFDEFWWQRKNQIMILKKLELKLASNIEVSADVDLSRWKKGLSEFRTLPVNINVQKESLEIQLEGSIREGKILGSFKYSPGEKAPIRSEFKFDYFPLTQILKILEKPTRPSLANLWMNCVVSAQSEMEASDLIVDLRQCLVIEKSGKIELGQLQLKWPYMSTPQLNSQGVVFVKNWPLQMLMGVIGREGPTGVFKDMGQLSGEVKIESNEKMNFQWEIENSVAIFSRASQKTLQKINKIGGQLSFDSGRISGLIDKAELDRGEFIGKLSFNLNNQFSAGVLQVGIEHLKFHPLVQKVMVGGVLGSMGIFGQATIANASLERWRGNFAVGKIFGDKWGLKRLKLKSLYDGDAFNAKVSLAELELASNHPFKPWMQKVYSTDNDGAWKLAPIGFEMQIKQGSLYWDKLKASFQGRVARSSGNWNRKQLFGNVYAPGNKQAMTLLGEEYDWFLKDSENNLIPVFADSSVLPNVKAIEPIKNLGQQMMNTAKKIIPGSEETPPDKAGEVTDEKPGNTSQ